MHEYMYVACCMNVNGVLGEVCACMHAHARVWMVCYVCELVHTCVWFVV